jgi:hypothetical protein
MVILSVEKLLAHMTTVSLLERVRANPSLLGFLLVFTLLVAFLFVLRLRPHSPSSRATQNTTAENKATTKLVPTTAIIFAAPHVFFGSVPTTQCAA